MQGAPQEPSTRRGRRYTRSSGGAPSAAQSILSKKLVNSVDEKSKKNYREIPRFSN